MTEVIYYSDSISKTVAVFAIECAIVVVFIILLMFCCTGKVLGSGDITTKNKDAFIFKKYSSKNKISSEQIENLYKQNTIETKDKTKDKTTGRKLYELMFKSSKSDGEKIYPSSNSNLKKTIINPNTLCCSLTDTECDKKQEIKNDNIKLEEIACEEIVREKIVEEESKITDNVNNLTIFSDNTTKSNEPDIEKGLNVNKIYLVYEFNNLDKMTNPTSYMESDVIDEFDELEEFVNMVIKSFEKKYNQVGVLLKISSPGGSAFKFEHAYLNLLRLKDKGIELVGLVDKMAASGGYMLASACDKIVCAKYATIGSIGVIAQLYNWSELSKKVGFEEKTWTTGSHKNPFPMGSSYTEEDNQRMKEMIDETFDIFKSIVMESRKFSFEQMEEIEKAKTFPGFKALELNMVDNLELSSDYMDNLNLTNNIWICSKEKKSKSLVSSLLMDMDLKSIGINLISKVHNKLMIDKKINSVKLQ
jgi:signal peptide peptidase SppA